ncbi:ribonuclease H-like YkuK family protein [Candidatus Daviesbacteria bacterium]|nr:ribonuclease H-like YkuK family protein [Candidatus Daviesbacteria bacterium]
MNKQKIEKFADRRFHSARLGELTFEDMVRRVIEFIHVDPDSKYKIIVGSDSQPGYHVDFVSAVVVHRVGHGGIYFWSRHNGGRIYSFKERIYREALDSLELAQELLEEFNKNGVLECDLEIHVDIGTKGPTREMISEIVGMIRGNGFRVHIKPDSFAASSVADRHT